MPDDPIENTDLQGTLMEHSRQLGAAVERLNAVEASRQTFDIAAAGISDLSGRVSNLVDTQGEVIARLERLEAVPAIETEIQGTGDALDPAQPTATDPPATTPNDTEGKRPGFFAWLHERVG